MLGLRRIDQSWGKRDKQKGERDARMDVVNGRLYQVDDISWFGVPTTKIYNKNHFCFRLSSSRSNVSFKSFSPLKRLNLMEVVIVYSNWSLKPIKDWMRWSTLMKFDELCFKAEIYLKNIILSTSLRWSTVDHWCSNQNLDSPSPFQLNLQVSAMTWSRSLIKCLVNKKFKWNENWVDFQLRLPIV